MKARISFSGVVFRSDYENLINFEALTFDMPTMAHDFPADGRRLVQHAKGYEATLVNGTQRVTNAEFTGELPEKLLCSRQFYFETLDNCKPVKISENA